MPFPKIVIRRNGSHSDQFPDEWISRRKGLILTLSDAMKLLRGPLGLRCFE